MLPRGGLLFWSSALLVLCLEFVVGSLPKTLFFVFDSFNLALHSLIRHATCERSQPARSHGV